MRFLRGQAAVALSLAIPMMVGAACIGADMWALYRSSARLQHAADMAVLTGAAYLPAHPALAQSAARSKAQSNGILEGEIVYNRTGSDSRSLTMVVERKVPHHFGRLFGLSPSLVMVKAVARAASSQPATGLLPIGIQLYDAHYTVYRPVVLKLASLRSPASVDSDATATNYASWRSEPYRGSDNSIQSQRRGQGRLDGCDPGLRDVVGKFNSIDGEGNMDMEFLALVSPGKLPLKKTARSVLTSMASR